MGSAFVTGGQAVKVTTAKAPPPEPYKYQHYPLWVMSKVAGKKVVVKDAVEHAYHIGEPVEEVEREDRAAVPPASEPKEEYKPQPYPKWVMSKHTGKKEVVKDAAEEEHLEEKTAAVAMEDKGWE
jgi:hypothetical protein